MPQLINSYRFATAGGGGSAGPTRFYLEVDAPAPVSPAYSASWDNTALDSRLGTHPTRRRTVLGNVAGNASSNSLSNINALQRQMVSLPLAAQTIDGTVKGIIRGAESAAGCDYRTQLVIRVVSNDGATVRATLLAADSGALASEFSTTHTTRKIPVAYAGAGVSLTPYTCIAGDRLVIEVGARKHAATAGWVTTLWGSDGASDFLEDETQTTALNPWIEFSDGIEFQSSTTPSLISATTATTAASGTTETIAIPAGVEGGDHLILVSAHFTPITGATSPVFTSVEEVASNVDAAILYRLAAGTPGSPSSDAGGTLTVNYSVAGNGALGLFVVRGGSGIADHGLVIGATNPATRNAGAYAVPGDLVLYAGAVRSSSGTVIGQSTGTVDAGPTASGQMRGLLIGHTVADAIDDGEQQWTSSVTGGSSAGSWGAVIVLR